MEYLWILFLHVLFGIVWAGGGIILGFFIVPSVLDAGPAGGAVMLWAVRRKLPVIMTIAGTIVIVTGLRLYMLRFSMAWLGTANGIVLSLGAILALGAFAIGVFVQRPAAQRMSTLAAEIAKAGGQPDPARAAEVQALRAKLGMAARLTAWHLMGAATLMAAQRIASRL
jgi:uncharacterized membrane protein